MKKILSSFLPAAVIMGLVVLFFGCGVLPPVISNITVLPSGSIVAGSSVTISADAISYSGLALSYSWSASGGTLSSSTGSLIGWTAPASTGTYTITLVVSDGTNSATNTVNLVVVSVGSPVIGSTTYTPRPVATGKEITFTCSATDPGGLALEYSWSAPDGGLISSKGESVAWKSPATAGTYRINVTVMNTKGLSDSDILDVPVVVPQKPVLNLLTASPQSVATGGTVDLTCGAEDLDGFTLTYRWTNNGGAFSAGEASTSTWTAPATTGTYTITVTAFNGYLRSDPLSVTITVN